MLFFIAMVEWDFKWFYRIFRSKSNQIVNIRRGDEENSLWADAVVQPTTCYGL